MFDWCRYLSLNTILTLLRHTKGINNDNVDKLVLKCKDYHQIDNFQEFTVMKTYTS